MHVSIVIPCFNSGQWVGELCERVSDTMDSTGKKWELILVNDESSDSNHTWKEIVKSSEGNENIIGIDLQRNSGQFTSTLCGLEVSSGEIIVMMDDDLQHRPEDIPSLLNAIDEPGVDCVMGKFTKKKHSLVRNCGSWIVRNTYKYFHDLPKGVEISSFRAVNRSVAEMMCNHRTANPVIGAILLKSSRNPINVDIEHQERAYGTSGYTVRKLVKTTLDNIFLATTFPLRFFSYIGVVTLLGSIGASSYFLWKYLSSGSTVPGFTTLALLQLFLIGVTSMGLGLLGQYVDRVIDEVDKRPRWHIRESVGNFNGKC